MAQEHETKAGQFSWKIISLYVHLDSHKEKKESEIIISIYVAIITKCSQ